MRTTIPSRLGTVFGGLALLVGLASADVTYVDATGNGDYLQIQPAINAALDGDVILVRSGNYAAFTLDQRKLSIVEDAGAAAKVQGTVVVKNVSFGGYVLLAGLEITAPNGSPVGAPALLIENCPGHVRLQDCGLRGGDGGLGFPTGGNGGASADIRNSLRVSFTAVDMRGGNGYGSIIFGPDGGNGGAGLESRGSSVSFYDCNFRGGAGGDADYAVPTTCGDGGPGALLFDLNLLASGCSIIGGVGGNQGNLGGAGGDGLVVLPPAQARLISNFYAGGMGGWGYLGGVGPQGQAQSGGGAFLPIGGVRRKFHAPVLTPEGGMIQVQVQGQAGDRVWLLSTQKPGYVFFPGLAGTALVPFPSLMPFRFLGSLPPSGVATFSTPAPNLDAPSEHQATFFQGLIQTTAGVRLLGSPVNLVTLNCSSLAPDCNGNAECDSCDMLRAVSLDCDANGVPDECQADCNGNGVADPCDILSGTSVDLNHNTIPDECEVQTTWHVDDSAAPGGNGSAASPFQSLAHAFAAAISGDTILVADGIYSGSNHSFGSRSLTVVSSGGALACTIDCQGVNRAFRVDGVSATGSLIAGFRIVNGKAASGQAEYGGGAIRVQQPSATIADCIFENCKTQDAGGAVLVRGAQVTIRGCTFLANDAPFGGALTLEPTGSLGVVDCAFVSNTSRYGGAAYMGGFNPAAEVRFERCAFLTNSATIRGGALYCDRAMLQFDQCLLAGNSAPEGGAIADHSHSTRLTSCTLVDNHASLVAGAWSMGTTNVTPTLRSARNSIFWGNTAPAGIQFDVRAGTFDIDSCSVEIGAASVQVIAPGQMIFGPRNQTLAPQFVDPDGIDNNPATVIDNDYRLLLTSPCVDAGENAQLVLDWFDLDGDGVFNEELPLDFDAQTRRVDIPQAPDTGLGSPPLVDLGVFERRP